jgi:hypothetical protein
MDRHWFRFTGITPEALKAELAAGKGDVFAERVGALSNTREDVKTWFDISTLTITSASVAGLELSVCASQKPFNSSRLLWLAVTAKSIRRPKCSLRRNTTSVSGK